MKFYYPHLKPDEKPITTVAEYQAQHKQAEEVRQKWLRLHMRGDPQTEALRKQKNKLRYSLRHRLPYVLVSRCPFCDVPTWQKARIFSLRDAYWYVIDDNGRQDVHPDSLCPHLFCIDGALNLNGQPPTEAQGSINRNKRITIAAEVPFIKPRVLSLPTMVAVIHSLPVGLHHTGYPVTYFALKQPDQDDFCIPWARREYSEHRDYKPYLGVITGIRSEKQEYELEKWIQQGKVLWLDPEDGKHPVVRDKNRPFPYRDIPGRRHPYYMKAGRVFDLPDPVETKATTHWEDPLR